MKYWLIATYKTNETKRLENNLSNQNFDYYLPKIVIRKNNSILGEEVLFPGYIFINTTLDNYTLLKYTKGIKKVLKFGKTIPSLTDNEIKTIQSVVKLTKSKPISKQIKLGQEAIIAEGPFKGTLVKICSLPSKNRIEVLLTILGSQRRVSFLKKDLLF
tara:strand:+ start:99 stop:575 length:477 start_codon:yes stop_codon:yes gene_type:complete